MKGEEVVTLREFFKKPFMTSVLLFRANDPKIKKATLFFFPQDLDEVEECSSDEETKIDGLLEVGWDDMLVLASWIRRTQTRMDLLRMVEVGGFKNFLED